MVVSDGTLVQSPRGVHAKVAVAKQTNHTTVNLKVHVVVRCATERTSCVNFITIVRAIADGADLEVCCETQVRTIELVVFGRGPDCPDWVWCARHVCDCDQARVANPPPQLEPSRVAQDSHHSRASMTGNRKFASMERWTQPTQPLRGGKPCAVASQTRIDTPGQCEVHNADLIAEKEYQGKNDTRCKVPF